MNGFDRRLQRLEARLPDPPCPVCAKRVLSEEHFDFEGFRRIFAELVGDRVGDPDADPDCNRA